MEQPIFKACTRTAMVASVPTKPLMVSNGLIILAVMWLNFMFQIGLLWLVLVIPNYFFLRYLTKKDDAIFNLLWLKFQCRRSSARNADLHQGAVYSPIEFKKRGQQ
ncbi:type IV secretion system protein VirB3 [Vibrio scophthalmi]|uniref:Type IV secretion (PTiA6 VirB3) n=1 Tax=Vibrio scophthalmi LMG 19158 TaxID=870967 RepID=F9RQM7_9VIBR|nr:VirB3 family type IV secretion system protein [Vibrio scophthalmi]EGU33958.1 type IV secretion (pTiA6 VirB3) [Vibrio scophthalmi LMG 19158]